MFQVVVEAGQKGEGQNEEGGAGAASSFGGEAGADKAGRRQSGGANAGGFQGTGETESLRAMQGEHSSTGFGSETAPGDRLYG